MAPITAANLHEGLNPLHVFPNQALELIITSSNYITNNTCLLVLQMMEFLEINHLMHNSFAYVSTTLHVGLGSILFGSIHGIIMCKMFKHFNFLNNDPIRTIILIIINTILLYKMAHLSWLGLSGDVSIIFFALCIRYYGIFNFSPNDIKWITGYIAMI